MSKFFPDKFPGIEGMGKTFLPNLGKLLLNFFPLYSEVKLALHYVDMCLIKKDRAIVSLVRGFDGGIVYAGTAEGPFVYLSRLDISAISEFETRSSGLRLKDVYEKIKSFAQNKIELALPAFRFSMQIECNDKCSLGGSYKSRSDSENQTMFFPTNLKHGWAKKVRRKINFSLEQISGEKNLLGGISVGRVDSRDPFYALGAYWEDIIPEGTTHRTCIQDVAEWTLKWEAAAKVGRDLVNIEAMWEQYKLAMEKYKEFLTDHIFKVGGCL